jgi:hypothetical protein
VYSLVCGHFQLLPGQVGGLPALVVVYVLDLARPAALVLVS